MTTTDQDTALRLFSEKDVRLCLDRDKALFWLGHYRLAVEFDRRRDEDHLEVPVECTTIRTKAVFMNGMGGDYRMSEDTIIRDPARDATLDELVAYCLREGRLDDPEPHPEGTRFRKPIAARWEPPVTPAARPGGWSRDHRDNPFRQEPEAIRHRAAPYGWCPCFAPACVAARTEVAARRAGTGGTTTASTTTVEPGGPGGEAPLVDQSQQGHGDDEAPTAARQPRGGLWQWLTGL